ncbi:MAG: CAP domain-containing protein [Paracoccaceae bacterium]
MMRFVLALIWMAQSVAADSSVLSAINAERSERGLVALTWDAELEQAAARHALDLHRTGRFSHDGSDGSNVLDRVSRTGFRACFAAENIAKGQRSLPEVMNSWMQSKGHRRNILSRRAKSVAVVLGKDNLWVMVLAAPC